MLTSAPGSPTYGRALFNNALRLTGLVRDRVIGCLKGIATGDAIGKQTETLSYHDVVRWYPDGVRGFEGQPGAPMPRYVGNTKHEWRIGETTDDTERTIAVARAILKLMTCLVFSLEKGEHIHFVYGSDGGFTSVAKQLKSRAKRPT